MRAITGILLTGLVLSMSSIAYAEKGHRRGPPPEALEACSGQAVDTACSFTSRRGDEVSGMCHQTRKGDMACKPEGRGGRKGRRPPPSEQDEAS